MALGFSHPFGLPTAQTSPGHPSLVSFSDGSLRVPPTSVCAPCLPRGQSGLRPSWVGRCLMGAVGTSCCAGRLRVPHSALPSPLCPGRWAEAPGSPEEPSSVLGAAPALARGAASATLSVSERCPGPFCHPHTRAVASPTRVSSVALSRLYERFSGWKVLEIVRGNMSSALE